MGRAIHGFTIVVLGLAAHAGELTAQDSAAMARFHAIPWADGPTNGGLSEAQVRVPEGCRFAGAAGTREFLEFTENPVSGNERGVMLCRGAGEQRSWFVIFAFDDIRLVKDEEKDELDVGEPCCSLPSPPLVPASWCLKRQWKACSRSPSFEPCFPTPPLTPGCAPGRTTHCRGTLIRCSEPIWRARPTRRTSRSPSWWAHGHRACPASIAHGAARAIGTAPPPAVGVMGWNWSAGDISAADLAVARGVKGLRKLPDLGALACAHAAQECASISGSP